MKRSRRQQKSGLRNDLFERCIALLRRIPKGKVVSYSEIARQLGIHPRHAGKLVSMNKNPEIPCHRVVREDGSVGGYSLGTVEEKVMKLKKEGVVFEKGKISRKSFFNFGQENV